LNLPGRASGAFSAWEIGLALRYLRAKRKEGGVATIAVISFIGIMLAVAVLISVMSIMAGFLFGDDVIIMQDTAPPTVHLVS
jgi:lipoprotein-releasing system permease protein